MTDADHDVDTREVHPPTMARMTVTADPRPRSSLGRIVHDLGTTLLERVDAVSDESRLVGEVVIHDPADDLVISPDACVLGVGIVDAADMEELLQQLGRSSAACLMVKHRTPPHRSSRAGRIGRRSGATGAEHGGVMDPGGRLSYGR